ncbi:hypothetical protein KJ586_04445 [Patescibacteria group bacterium]|nr:hypothetical protein [Patescibacteria group bacterium]
MEINWLKLLNIIHFGRLNGQEMILNFLSFFCARVYLAVLLGLNLLNWFAAYTINKNVSQNLIVLHYNIDFGVNLIGGAKKIYLIPLLGLIIILINFILSAVIHRQGKFIVHLLLSGAILANLFLLAGLASLYLINFR